MNPPGPLASFIEVLVRRCDRVPPEARYKDPKSSGLGNEEGGAPCRAVPPRRQPRRAAVGK